MMNRKTKHMIVVLVGFVSVIVYSAGYFFSKNNRDAITITSYASSVEFTLDDLIAKSDLIVVGEFINQHPSRWNTANGKLPDDATTDSISKQHLTIFTDAEFRVSQYVKGDHQLPVLRVRTFGGQVGQDRMIVSGEPSYKIGQQYLLFLFRNIGRTANINSGSYYGIGSPIEIVDGKAISADDEWLLEDLIAYIEKSLSGDVLPVDVVVETPVLFTDTPTLTPIPAETLMETETPQPIESLSETPITVDTPTSTP